VARNEILVRSYETAKCSEGAVPPVCHLLLAVDPRALPHLSTQGTPPVTTMYTPFCLSLAIWAIRRSDPTACHSLPQPATSCHFLLHQALEPHKLSDTRQTIQGHRCQPVPFRCIHTLPAFTPPPAHPVRCSRGA
jgi:hypothetical protein